MSRRLRTTAVAVPTGILLATSVGTAFALQDEESTGVEPTVDLATVKEWALDRITKRIEWFTGRIEGLQGGEGVAAEQRLALSAEGIAIFEDLADDVEAAAGFDALFRSLVEARQEYRAHRRVRSSFVHVQQDLDAFARRLAPLETGIERASGKGLDTAGAAVEAAAALVDLEDAQEMLDAVDPSLTGEEVAGDLREARRTAHAAQAHVRAGWQELRAAAVVVGASA